MTLSTDTITGLWNRCARMHNDLEEGLFSMFPRDWESLSERLNDALGDLEELSPSRRQQFAQDFGR